MGYEFYVDIDLFESALISNGIDVPSFWILPECKRVDIMKHYSETDNVNKFSAWLQNQDCFMDIVN